MRSPRLAGGLLLVAAGAAGALACSTPPQVVEIAPERGAQQVPSNAEIRIRFDRPVDQASVGAHFSTQPAVEGSLTWVSSTQLVFKHDPFRAGTRYTVRLGAGYRDTARHANNLNHSWSFVTEPAPALTGSNPGPGERYVDPATDLTLAFSRPMDVRTVRSALSVVPPVRISVSADPLDPRRVVIAPQTLLDAGTSYSITVTPDARDVDGNPLPHGASLEFSTGSLRPLRHWVTFSAVQDGADGGVGIWVVDPGRQPREVIPIPARTFSWSEDGTRLLVQGTGGAWFDAEVGGKVTRLPFSASWAAFLGGDRGLVYLRDGRLVRYTSGGTAISIDDSVSEAAVAPGGLKIAYAVAHAGGGGEVRGYDVDLRSHYRLQAEPGPVDGLAWAPDSARLAYRVGTADSARSLVRVRDLAGSGRAATVAIGDAEVPAWQADSRHLVLGATVAGPSGATSRAFRVSATDGATRPLAYADAIPSSPLVPVKAPQPSPDGHTLAFLAPAEGGLQVWVMNADGTGLGQLTRFDPAAFPYSCRALAWTRR